jgi:hypothetical protein
MMRLFLRHICALAHIRSEAIRYVSQRGAAEGTFYEANGAFRNSEMARARLRSPSRILSRLSACERHVLPIQ